MGRQIAVSETKPVGAAKPADLIEETPAFPGNPPAGARIWNAAKRVHHRVEIRGHMQPEMLEVIGGIDDHRKAFAAQSREPMCQFCSADTAGKRDNASAH